MLDELQPIVVQHPKVKQVLALQRNTVPNGQQLFLAEGLWAVNAVLAAGPDRLVILVLAYCGLRFGNWPRSGCAMSTRCAAGCRSKSQRPRSTGEWSSAAPRSLTSAGPSPSRDH